MPDPKDKLENGVYVLKSVARPWLALEIGDVVDPHTKARNGWVYITCSLNSASDYLCLIVKVEQVDENHRRQHVCSSSPAFSSYYISNSGGSRINALASSVMVSTPSNHREREKSGIFSLMPGLRKCEQN